MSDVLCVTDQVPTEGPFQFICDQLINEFDCKLVSLTPNSQVESVSNVYDLLKMGARTIVTNCLQPLDLSKSLKVLFYACSSDGRPFISPDLGLRRQFQLRPEIEMFCSSLFLAKAMFVNYSIQSRVQYPCVSPRPFRARPLEIIFNRMSPTIGSIINELPGEIFKPYENIASLTYCKLYIHIPDYEEATNITMQVAASLGVPTVTSSSGCLPELINLGDTLLPSNANVKQWVQGVKTSIRDTDNNSENVLNSSRRWNTIDSMTDKLKQLAQRKAIQIALGQSPPMAPPPSIDPLTERANMSKVNKKSKVNPSHSPEQPPEIHQPQLIPPPVVDRYRYVKPASTKMLVPEWFQETEKPSISVVVSMYECAKEITDQINNWHFSELATEILYVNDCCPQYAYTEVLNSWKKRKPSTVGKIILLSNHSGYATSCNEGAKHSTGEYLVFLGANTTVTQQWLEPMYNLLRNHPEIGIVSCLQLENDSVYSAGMEWMPDSKTYEHIGRQIYNGKSINTPILLSEMSSHTEPMERNMVSGNCLMISRNLFDEVGGFDIGYRMYGWENFDLVMKVKAKGYKVFYHPDSIIHIKPKGVVHKFSEQNAELFRIKWGNHLTAST